MSLSPVPLPPSFQGGDASRTEKLSYRSAMWTMLLAGSGLLGLVALVMMVAFLRIVSIAEKAEQEVVPQVLLQQQQAVMASDLGRVAETILGIRDRSDRASALTEAETIAHRFALVTSVDLQSKLDAALHAVRRSAYRADMLDALEESVSGHLLRVDALLPPLGGSVSKVDSYATQLLFEARHVLYEAAIARTEERLQALRQRFTVLGAEMRTVSQNGTVPRTGGRPFTLADLEKFTVIFDLRGEYLAVREQVKSETATARGLLVALSESLSADAAANASQSASDIVAMGHSGIIIVVLAAAGALVVLAGMIAFLFRHTVTPILQAHSALAAVQRGEATVHVPSARLREFDALGQSVQQLGAVLGQLKANERSALRTKEQLQFIFDVSPVPFVLNNIETSEVIAANDAACSLFRIDKASFNGRLMREFWVYPRHRDEMVSFLGDKGQIDGFETHMLTASGADFWATISARKVLLEGQEVILSAFYDITEQRAYETRLRKLVEDLEDSNRELEQFAYVASHDLQEPLRLVMSYLRLLELKHNESLSREAKDFIGFASDSAHRMQQVIMDLLAYSRVGRDISFGHVDLNLVAKEALADLALLSQESQATFSFSETLPTVLGDRGELGRLFQNLLGNALKYRAQDRLPQVVISSKDAKDGWEITLADNGIGIDPDYAERVFVMFQRLHPDHEYSGTGIGLAICRKIMEQHNGRIWVDPAGGCGSQGEGCALKLWFPK